MDTHLKLKHPGFALRRSAPGFHDRDFHRTSNVHVLIPSDKMMSTDRIFGVQTAVQKAQAAQIAAERANQAKSDFLADMSHEIRTPMGAIVGLTNILLSTKLDERQRQCITALQGSAEGLMVMLKSLLDIGKIESGTMELKYQPFIIAPLLEQIVALMSVKAQEKGIALTLYYEPGLPETLIGDSGRIRQVVLNLIGNAIKFTETGGVTVSFATGEEKNGKKQIAISVADTGIGIPEDKIGAIFDRYTQAGPAIAREYCGTGLGLSISKALAEKMGGGIAVNSAVGKGSTFVLLLPVRTEGSGNEHHSGLPALQYATNYPQGAMPMIYIPAILMLALLINNFGWVEDAE